MFPIVWGSKPLVLALILFLLHLLPGLPENSMDLNCKIRWTMCPLPGCNMLLAVMSPPLSRCESILLYNWYLCFLPLFFSFNRILCCVGSPRAHCIDQGGPKLTEIPWLCQLSARIKGVCTTTLDYWLPVLLLTSPHSSHLAPGRQIWEAGTVGKGVCCSCRTSAPTCNSNSRRLDVLFWSTKVHKHKFKIIF